MALHNINGQEEVRMGWEGGGGGVAIVHRPVDQGRQSVL